MPRLSLWKNGKRSRDYEFFDKRVLEQLTIGGTAVNVHKYLGSGNEEENILDTISEKNIQDLLFLENRDRKYDRDIYEIRGYYNVNDLDFDLSQFGLFLQNDTLFIVFHINDMIERIGRKIIAGDVLELPHLRDFFSLDSFIPAALRRYYVVQEATRAAEGYSPTWWPHLWRVKATPLVDGREYRDLLENLEDEDGNSLSDTISTYKDDIEINEGIIEEAKSYVAMAGYDTRDLYTLPVDHEGNPLVFEQAKADSTMITADNAEMTADIATATPTKRGYEGYLIGDGTSPNDHPVIPSIEFPSDPEIGMYVLRLDYKPNRLFRYDGRTWVHVEDNVRTSYIPSESERQLSTFTNNTNKFKTADGQEFLSKQALSQAIKPKSDY